MILLIMDIRSCVEIEAITSNIADASSLILIGAQLQDCFVTFMSPGLALLVMPCFIKNKWNYISKWSANAM